MVDFMEIKSYQVLMGRKRKEHISFEEAYKKVEKINQNGQRVRDVV